MGYHVYQGNVDIETIHNLMGYTGIWFIWHKFKPIIREYRKIYGAPDYFRWFEYLVDELAKERIRQGFPADVIDAEGYTIN